MPDILDGFTSSQVEDHNSEFDLNRILDENTVSVQISEFITYLSDSKYIQQGSWLELAVEKAAKEVNPLDQLKTMITESRLSLGNLLGDYYYIFAGTGRPPIAPMFQQHLDDLKRNNEFNALSEAFPNVIALKIKEFFFTDDPLAFEKFMCWKGDSFQERFDWQKLYLFYGNDPFEVYFNAIISDGVIDSDNVYTRIWEKYSKDEELLAYNLNKSGSGIDPTDIDLRQRYKDCMEAGLKWHKKLLDTGEIKEAEKWEKKLENAYYCQRLELESETKQLDELYLGKMVCQRLDIPGAKTSPEDHKKWIEASFKIGKTPYQDENGSSETAVKYFRSSLNIIDWKSVWHSSILSKSGISAKLPTFHSISSLPIYWYASPFREEWLNCVEDHIKKVNIPKKLEILNYLLCFTVYNIVEVDDYGKKLPEGRDLEFVDEKTQHRWASAGKPIGENFLKGKLKLEFNELIIYFDLLFQHRKKFEFGYEDLIPYADKIMAFSRPKFKNPADGFNIHEYENAYRVLLSYAPDKLLRNLLHTFRMSPAPCSGEGLEFGVGEDLRLGGSIDRYPLHWWISIMIHNCLRTPYDSRGNKLDKDGNKINGNELIVFSKPLRQTFADFCFKGLRLKKGESVTKGKYDESQCMESDSFWRQGFIFALSEIGLDLGGKAHRTLDFVSKHDPDEHVRGYAKNVYKSLRRKQHSNEDDPVKGMLIAFWWLRLAQRNSMNENIDRPAATRVRRNELRYSQKTSFSLLRQ